jgi:hypothetical protein
MRTRITYRSLFSHISGTLAATRASARSGIEFTTQPRAEVHYDEMTFFTHRVNGETYGGWYRQLSARELEVMGTGFLCRAAYAGYDELSVARSVLEEFVQGQKDNGVTPQSLEDPDHRANPS